MSPELAAVVVALAVAVVRELLAWLDARSRRRGAKRTRADDDTASEP